MKWTIISLTALVFLSACNMRPQRVAGKGKSGNASQEGSHPSVPGSGGNGNGNGNGNGPMGIPTFVDSNDPLDTYLSVGPYLQKEFDAAQGPGKTVKVYIQVRQENSIEKNFAALKDLMGPIHASIPGALEAALKKGDSTVEFEADVATLKTSVTMMNQAVSGIELSLPQVN